MNLGKKHIYGGGHGISRRQILKGLAAGTAVLASPFSLVRAARAAAPVKRAIFVYIPDGCIPGAFHPQGSEFDFQLGAMTEPLASVRQHCTFLDGLNMYEGGLTHEGGVRKVLTANASQSIDTKIADEIGGGTAFPHIYLGVGANFENGSGGFSFSASGAALPADDNPLNAYGRIFGGFEGGGGSGSEPAADPRLRILDSAITDVARLQTRLGQTERQRLEEHLEALREVENRLEGNTGGGGGVACDPSAWNQVGFTVPSGWHGYPPKYDREEHFVTVGQLQMDLIVEAMACDLTRVASLQWSHPVSPTFLSWTGAGQRHHDASHFGNPNTQSAQDFILSQRFFVERFASLIESLAGRADPSGDGTLLDHTRILLFSELGDSNAHDHKRMPFILAGAGSDFPGGRLLSYDGESHAKLLVSVARSMGLSLQSWGYTGHGTGGLPELGV